MNTEVLAQLSDAEAIARIPAKLERADNGALITFLYNPESLSRSRDAKYGEVPVAAIAGAPLNYLRTGNPRLEIPDLLIDGHCARKSVRSLLDDLDALLLPTGAAEPPPSVFFIWGTERWGPSVLESISVQETGWLNGEPAIARVSLSLVKLIESGVEAATEPTAPTGQVALSTRQQTEAQTRATAFLRANANRLIPTARAAIGSQRFSLAAAADGIVTLSGLDGTTLGTVGTWDGFDFWNERGLFGE